MDLAHLLKYAVCQIFPLERENFCSFIDNGKSFTHKLF